MRNLLRSQLLNLQYQICFLLVLFFMRCLREVVWVFLRDFSNHFCFGGRVKLVYIALPDFLLGFLYGFVCFCSE